jgi:branched-chain amino acid aminotransferase
VRGSRVSIVVAIDGQIRRPGEETVSVFDRGFLYGDSVFETLRSYGGKPFALDEHLARLERSAALVFIDMPLSRAQWRAEINEALRAAANTESYVRVLLTRGESALGLDPALAERPRRVIIVQPLAPPPAEYYSRGIAAISHRAERVTDATGAAGAKVGNYLLSVLALRKARLEGAAEALIVDGQGRVLEGGSSNVFVASGGRLRTAPLEAGILAGITRARFLELADRLGFAVELRAPLLEEARRADEIFITSSIREALAVVRLDGAQVGQGSPGPIYCRLLEAFRELVRNFASTNASS